jgi:hypothetical protein
MAARVVKPLGRVKFKAFLCIYRVGEQMEQEMKAPVDFKVDEVLEIKGWLFKVTVVDAFTNKLCLKRISEREAAQLRGPDNP